MARRQISFGLISAEIFDFSIRLVAHQATRETSDGYSILTECRDETWQLTSRTSPSLVRRNRISFPTCRGSPRFLLTLLPASPPQITTTSSGPAISHADFSPVTA